MCCIPRVDSNNVNQGGAQMWAVCLRMSNTVLRSATVKVLIRLMSGYMCRLMPAFTSYISKYN